MASTGKRPKKRKQSIVRKPKRKAAKGKKRPAPKRKRAKTVPVPARTRTRTRKSKPAKRKPIKPKKSAKQKRIEAAIRRARAEREERQGREYGTGDVEVIDEDGDPVASDYRTYPIPDRAPSEVRWAEVPADQYKEAMDWLEDRFGLSDDHAAADAEEIEWFPTFDEVYDYIDALVEMYDLDAHELFELAFGYSDETAA